MQNPPQILAVGSVLWDIIGHTDQVMKAGQDVGGHITRLPGGVALNIAMALKEFGLDVALLSSVGRDAEGDNLIHLADEMGLVTAFVHRSHSLPTDRYMAIEGENGLIAAIADAHSLEAAGAEILAPLLNGELASVKSPWQGVAVLDGNLTETILSEIADGALFRDADLRIAPASPGKAARLASFIGNSHATLYLNLAEANILTNQNCSDTKSGAQALIAMGLERVVVTNGSESASIADRNSQLNQTPPVVKPVRITGAGDAFMAAHIAAELNGQTGEAALSAALKFTANYISNKD